MSIKYTHHIPFKLAKYQKDYLKRKETLIQIVGGTKTDASPYRESPTDVHLTFSPLNNVQVATFSLKRDSPYYHHGGVDWIHLTSRKSTTQSW